MVVLGACRPFLIFSVSKKTLHPLLLIFFSFFLSYLPEPCKTLVKARNKKGKSGLIIDKCVLSFLCRKSHQHPGVSLSSIRLFFWSCSTWSGPFFVASSRLLLIMVCFDAVQSMCFGETIKYLSDHDHSTWFYKNFKRNGCRQIYSIWHCIDVLISNVSAVHVFESFLFNTTETASYQYGKASPRISSTKEPKLGCEFRGLNSELLEKVLHNYWCILPHRPSVLVLHVCMRIQSQYIDNYNTLVM